MPDTIKIGFVPFASAANGTLVVFCDDQFKIGAAASRALGHAAELIKRSAQANSFKGKSGKVLEILSPEGLKAARLLAS